MFGEQGVSPQARGRVAHAIVEDPSTAGGGALRILVVLREPEKQAFMEVVRPEVFEFGLRNGRL